MLIVSNYQFNRKDHLIVDVTAKSDTWSKNLSPFCLGPFQANGIQVQNLENLWQYSKVYEAHLSGSDKPKSEWFHWRLNGFKNSRAEPYPMGREAECQYFWWNKQRIEEVEARKEIYVKHYKKEVVKTDAWKKLCSLYVESKTNDSTMVLKDFNGYNHLALHMTFEDTVNNLSKPMGHAFILYKMLLDEFGDLEPQVSLF